MIHKWCYVTMQENKRNKTFLGYLKWLWRGTRAGGMVFLAHHFQLQNIKYPGDANDSRH